MMTFTAALRRSGLTSPLVIAGPIEGEWFCTHIEQFLAAPLRLGASAIMDNPALHRAASIRHAIAAKSATLHDLPPHSPDVQRTN